MPRKTNFTIDAKPKSDFVIRAKPRFGVERFAEAIGAQEVVAFSSSDETPLGFFAVRQELVNRLRSTGGRPGIADSERRKISITEPVWNIVSQVAKDMSEPGFHPTASQVASALLSIVVRSNAQNLVREARQSIKDAESVA